MASTIELVAHAAPLPTLSLISSSISSTNTRALQSASRKRKRDDNTPADLSFPQEPTISIRPCPTVESDQPISLTPVKVLERAQLPLSFLDHVLPSTRLFSARIDVLDYNTADKSAQDESPVPHKVLIARSKPDKGFYAIEGVQYGLYSLCRLGSWVNDEDVRALPTHAVGPPCTLPLKVPKKGEGGRWWQTVELAVAAAAPPSLEHYSQNTPRLCMRRPARVAEGTSAATTTNMVSPPLQDAKEKDRLVDSGSQSVDEKAPEEKPRSAKDVFRAIAVDYLETLYLSNTSLAFFVKGPLSRARAEFAPKKEGITLPMTKLVAFMRSIVLQWDTLFKKYKEHLPGIIKSMPLPGLSDDDDVAEKPAAAEKASEKRARALKPDKHGLYTGEDEYVKKWWYKERPDSLAQDASRSVSDVMKKRIQDLRAREVMAQVVIVLEILALEASTPVQQATQQDSALQDGAKAQPQPARAKKGKSKKQQDLHKALDNFLDILCIWQSVEQDETLVKAPELEGGKGDAAMPKSGNSETSDTLKSFCVEVVLPFYWGRLPNEVTMIRKRLGGPSPSPLTTSKSGKDAVRPDSRSRRKRQSTLSYMAVHNAAHENAAHESMRRPLSRSSTEAADVKREDIETCPLSSIAPSQAHGKSACGRNSLSHFERFSRRTIDLDAMSNETQAKRNQKEKSKAHNEAANGTLRKAMPGKPKPRRVGGGGNKVLVGATPKRVGRKASRIVVQSTPRHRRNAAPSASAMSDDDDDDDNLPSRTSDPVVPSSVLRPSVAPPVFSDSVVPSSAVKTGTTGSGVRDDRVESTPSRGSTGKAVRWSIFTDTDDGCVVATPSRKPSDVNRGLRPSRVPPPAFKLRQSVLSPVIECEGSDDDACTKEPLQVTTPTKSQRRPVLKTPVKCSPVQADAGIQLGKDVMPSQPGQHIGRGGAGMINDENDDGSIYAQLGWDDADDLF